MLNCGIRCSVSSHRTRKRQGRRDGNGGDHRLHHLEIKIAEIEKDISHIKETMITKADGWKMLAILLVSFIGVLGIDIGIEF